MALRWDQSYALRGHKHGPPPASGVEKEVREALKLACALMGQNALQILVFGNMLKIPPGDGSFYLSFFWLVV